MWFLLYGALGAAWALGAPGFPWGSGDPDGEISLLNWLTPGPGGWAITAFCLIGAGVTFAVTRSAMPVWPAWPLAAVLIFVVPDARILMGLGYTPLLVVGPLFGWAPEGLTFADAWPWPVVNQVLCAAGGLLLAATALRHRRRDDCRCATDWTRPEAVARWGRLAVYVAVAVPLFYSVTRWSWGLGIPLGVSERFLAEGEAEEPGIWQVGAYLATAGAVGCVLTLGLVQRWGEIFPRWMPGLRGRRVPPLLAIIPAGVVSIAVTVTGMSYVRVALTGEIDITMWGTWLPSAFWPLWGIGLAAATLAYHLRRRPACPHGLPALSTTG
ncbi:hypothetical protein Ssi02_17630 [Sinosporangium siamense]|uniref:DUF3995 domain-containing protein n=1 Tax=Sinosporangium siamense TaxID=1367973 RepID=A0A919V6Z0_9ACTN|nr:hypothetical protein Ssi02_17630 [Sinosporangium siamense]